LWRRRWAGVCAIPIEEMSVVDRLSDAPRPGVQPRLTAEQVCQIVALACEQGMLDGAVAVRQAEWPRPTHQQMEPPRAGRRDRPPWHHRPHLAAPRCAVAQKRPTCSRTECGIGCPRRQTPPETRRSLMCAPCIAPPLNAPTRVSAPYAP